jgi:hypothetical protein
MKFSKWLTKEIIDGFSQWFKLCCYCTGLWFLLDLLPKLPEEFAKPIADRLVGLVK